MASELPPSPPPTPTTTNTTTITCLTDDLLREIFLRLPALPSLVCAAFACRAFHRAVRSSPAFRRSFRALHAPPLLALFFEPNMEYVPVFPLPCRRTDPDLVASDFSDIRLSRHGTGWVLQSWNSRKDGYPTLDTVGKITKWKAATYFFLTQDLDLCISRQYEPGYVHLNFYTISSDDGQGPSHVVCVRDEDRLTENTAFIFSSDTMEWQISRKATLVLGESERLTVPMLVRGLLCWRHWMHDQIVIFDTATCQFSPIDLPTPLKTTEKNKMEFDSTYKLGETKDGKLCIVDVLDDTVVSWFMAANNDTVVGNGRWMRYKEFSLHQIVMDFTGLLIEEDGPPFDVEPVAVISGYVYLSIFYSNDRRQTCHLYLSVCLETSEMTELFTFTDQYTIVSDPYAMAWPPSLVQSKEESDTEFTRDSVAGGRPAYTEEASTLLVTALQSFSQALMKDGDSNKEIVAELDAFFGPTEDEEGSLISHMLTLDAELRTVRDRILRIRT